MIRRWASHWQSYFEWNKRKIKSPLMTRQVQVTKTSSGVLKSRKYLNEAEYQRRIVDITVQTTQDETRVTDEAVTACAPNVIHSLDASFLWRVVNECEREGIPVWVVHDSFSTLAPYVARLNEILRQQFVELFDGYCLYIDLLKQNAPRMSQAGLVRLPINPVTDPCTIVVDAVGVAYKVPRKGNADGVMLDLKQIIYSKHCFG